jgi:hypothetical protein
MSKFDTSKVSQIVKIIANAGDSAGQMLTLRSTLAAQFKGLPRKMLGETETALLKDKFKAEFESRDTIAEKSVGPLTTNATKVARCMPVILGLSSEDYAKVGGSWGSLCKFATQVQSHEGDSDAALAAFVKGKKPDYKKSAAAHFKALFNMRDGKMWTPKQRAAIVEAAGVCGVEL